MRHDHPHRHLRLALWTLARHFLSEGPRVKRRELEFASRVFPTIEINGSFYSLQRPENYAAWYGEMPQDFVFAIKGGRYITHMLRLENCERAVANFFVRGSNSARCYETRVT